MESGKDLWAETDYNSAIFSGWFRLVELGRNKHPYCAYKPAAATGLQADDVI